MLPDSVQRSVNGEVSTGQSSITFDSPARSLLSGEGVKFANHATEYVISNPTDTTFTVTPALTSNIADKEKITRLDPYRLVEFDEIQEEYSEGKSLNDSQVAFLYRLALRTRQDLERRTEHVFKSRSIVEVCGVDYPTDTLILKYRPLVSVESVVIQYIGEATGTTIDSDNYSVNTEQGTIYYPTGWPVGQNHITVTYTAGWSVVPMDYQMKFLQLFNIMYAFTPTKGKDALMLASNSKLETSFRTLEDVDNWIDRNFPQRRLMI